jgi:hypothetical protein
MAAATIRYSTFVPQNQKLERATTLQTQTADNVLDLVGSQSHKVASALEDMFLRLDAISKLTEGWDSYGADAPSKGSLSVLRSLIGKVVAERLALIGERAIPFNVAPNPDGGVIAEWRNGPKLIEIDANPDGTYSYFVKYSDRSDERHGVDELAVLRLIPTVVD